MNKRNVGLFFVLVSLLLSSFNLLFTGAVVGISGVSLNLIAVVFFVAGVVLIFVGARLETLVVEEGMVSLPEVMERIKGVAGENAAVVVDTSFFMTYGEGNIHNLMDDLKNSYGGAIVNESVLDELRESLRNPVSNQSFIPMEGYEKYKEEVRGYLKKSDKAFAYEELIPIILGEKEAPRSRREAVPYIEGTKKLIKQLNGKAPTRDNLVAVADNRHWKVSDADVDVLAAALAEAKSGQNVVIAEKDVDFEYAVREVKRVDSELGKLIHCVNPYADAA